MLPDHWLGRVTPARGNLKKGDLSKFIEDVVRWRVLDQSTAEARTGFAHLGPDEMAALINAFASAVRPTAAVAINECIAVSGGRFFGPISCEFDSKITGSLDSRPSP